MMLSRCVTDRLLGRQGALSTLLRRLPMVDGRPRSTGGCGSASTLVRTLCVRLPAPTACASAGCMQRQASP